MLKKSLLFILLTLLIATCKPGKPVLPLNRPSDFKLDYHLDGGMSDYSVAILIHSDSCDYKKRQEGKVVDKSIKLTLEDLNLIYDLLKKNEFDKMESLQDKAIVYDRGGESVTVKWDNKSITVSNAQNNFVKEKWYEKWKMLCEGLDNFATKKAGI
ncbi:MAG: hypothetical protein ACXVNM_06195 [Bacteroidia bacterium]